MRTMAVFAVDGTSGMLVALRWTTVPLNTMRARGHVLYISHAINFTSTFNIDVGLGTIL